MNRRGPLMTLGAVAAFALVLLVANTLIIRPAKAGPARPAVSAAAVPRAPSHALYTGRSTDNVVTIAIAVNGRKAAGFLHFGFHGTAALTGSVNGSQVVLTGQGARLTGAVSAAAAAVFGTVTPVAGQSVPYAAQLTTETVIYAGRSSDNEVTLAVTTHGARATGYVCNGKTVSAWLEGSVSGNRVTLAGKNGAGLSGSVSGLDMFGTVTPSAGQTFPFSAELSPRPAGLYRADIVFHGLATVVGWAVLPDGTQQGVVVTGTTKQPAPMLDLSNGVFTLGGVNFTAAPVAGNATVVRP
jgi:hypothetical protein